MEDPTRDNSCLHRSDVFDVLYCSFLSQRQTTFHQHMDDLDWFGSFDHWIFQGIVVPGSCALGQAQQFLCLRDWWLGERRCKMWKYQWFILVGSFELHFSSNLRWLKDIKSLTTLCWSFKTTNQYSYGTIFNVEQLEWSNPRCRLAQAELWARLPLSGGSPCCCREDRVTQEKLRRWFRNPETYHLRNQQLHSFGVT